MQEKKVIEFLIRNNGRIQIVMLCVLLSLRQPTLRNCQ